MDFDLQALLAAHRSDGYELYGRYLNPQHPKVLHAIGFDKVYERAEGAYLYDTDGNLTTTTDAAGKTTSRAYDLRGRLTVSDALKVEIAGLYWHFVDIVWIAIFTLVYLIP